VKSPALVAVVVVIVAVVAYVATMPRRGEGGPEGAASEAIRVGVIAPLSGSLAPYGKGTLNGIEMRIEEVNAAGGVDGMPIRLFKEDNKGDKTESGNAYAKLVGTDGVVAVLGPVTSNNTIGLRRDAAKLKVPVISPTATNDSATLENPYVFRTCFRDSFQGRVVAQYSRQTVQVETAAVLTDSNSDYSKGLSESFRTAFEAQDGRIVAAESYRQGDTEFSAQLKKVIDAGAELLFVPGYPPEVPLIIKQARVMEFGGLICGADGWDNDAVLQGSGDGIEGCFITGMFSSEDDRPIVRSFVERAEERLGRTPGTFEAQGYDTASLLVEALGRGRTSEDVKEGLLAIENFPAVTGSITITEQGDARKNAVILRIVKNDEGTFVTRYAATVSP
jgi:branched-chain amino acid transport system substrate-binding protein